MAPRRSRIRVLRVIARLNTGGPARHVLILSGRLDPERFTTVLATGHVDAGQGEEEFTDTDEGRALARGVDLVRVAGLGRAVAPTDDLRALATLVGLCRRFRPHVVHTHTHKAGALGRLAAAIASRLPGGPPPPVVIHTYHGHAFHGYFGRIGTAATTAIERALVPLSDRIVTLSPVLREEISDALALRGRRRPTIVPLGLDLEELLAASEHAGELREELGWDEVASGGPLVIGAVGRLVPIKAFGVLLDALARVGPTNGAGPAPRLVIAGDGSERARLAAHARQLGIADRVELLGFRHDLARFYSGIDILAVSSINEGTPLAVIEAFAAGRPVVATAVGGVPDMFRKTGPAEGGITPCIEGALVAPGADPAPALARAIAELVADPERRRAAGVAARDAARGRFTAARLVRDIDRLYTEMVPARRVAS